MCSENVTKESLTSTRLSVESWNFTLLVYLNTKFHEKWTNSWWFLKDRTGEGGATIYHTLSYPPLIRHESWILFTETEPMQQLINRERHFPHTTENDIWKNIKENKNSLFNINQWRADSPCFGGCFLSDFLFPLNVLNGCISYVYFSRSSLIVVHGKGDIWYTVYEEENAAERPSTIWG